MVDKSKPRALVYEGSVRRARQRNIVVGLENGIAGTYKAGIRQSCWFND